MPQIVPVITAIAGAASVVGTFSSMKNQKKAGRAQQQQQATATRHQRRQAIREAQVSRAQAVASASAVGATGSSASLGGQASLSSQMGTQFGFGTQMSGLSSDISRYSRKASDGAAIAQIGGSVFQGLGGFGAFKPTTPEQAGMRPLFG